MSEAEELRDQSPQQLSSDGDTRISDAIGKLLKNPELIGMIGSMMASASKPASAEEEQPVSEEATPAVSGTDMIATIAPMLSSMQKAASTPHSAENDRRSCLLRALKPYLSKERCEAIDQMIRISLISDVFRNMS